MPLWCQALAGGESGEVFLLLLVEIKELLRLPSHYALLSDYPEAGASLRSSVGFNPFSGVAGTAIPAGEPHWLPIPLL